MDITMCANEECERREQCHRAMATPDVMQSWADFGQDCKNNDYRNQWEIRENNIYVDDKSNLLARC